MKRKVIKQGPSTLMVSLPSKWVKNKNIKRGDEINLFEQGEDIVISLKEKKQLKTIKTSIENLHPNQLDNYLSTLYTNGYDEIELIGNISLDETISSINNKVGLEIVGTEKDKILIKSYLNENEGDINKIIKKLFQLIKSFIKEINEKNCNLKLYTNLIAKTSIHCMRLIRKTEYKNKKFIDQFSFIRSLSRIGSSIGWFCEAIRTNKLPRTNLIKNILSLIEILEQAYLANDFVISCKSWDEFVRYQQKLNAKNISKLLQKEHPLVIVHYYAILRDLSNSFVYLRDITLPIDDNKA